MNEYEIMIKNLENRVTELEKQLFAGAVKTVEPVKWQPKGGDFYMRGDGYVVEVNSSIKTKECGTERDTYEQAERASIEMRRFNRLLALRDELCGDEVVDWSDLEKDKYWAFFSHERGCWYTSYSNTCQTVTPSFTTFELAQKACDMLNSGEVEL